ncbi:pyridoxal-phosphate dependent enzyme [Desulfurococcaceae archaeon MEX13E-LK6-19]|nr:pyridoxal-phosphate dependent enzyme [Desulfurococcaceae archaeon MEX13E-LK6-19]
MAYDFFTWHCGYCGFKESSHIYYWRCPKCGSPLDIKYEPVWKPRGTGVRRYSSCLPVKPVKTLGEGATPIIKKKVYGINVWFKLDYLNPTGSFKDRGAAVSLAYAYLRRFKHVVEDTSGNTGIAVTAYSRLYGMKSIIYMPQTAPRGKKLLIKSLGGQIVEAKNRGEAAEKVLEEATKKNTFYVAHTWSPLFIEGNTTIAYEAFEQGFDGTAVILPIGSGGLFLGTYRGFERLREWGLWKNYLFYIGVQGYSCQPVYEALHGHKAKGEDSSLADGIMVPNPPRLSEIVEIIKKNGSIVLVNNKDIVNSLKKLYKMGFIVEPTSASVVAGLKKALEDGLIDRGEDVLTVLTGSGLKTLTDIERYVS